MAEITQGAGVLTSTEIDVIGEILNISMGAAATAVSTMLDKQVLITTPAVEVQKFHDVSYAAMEPAVLVKIQYVEGLQGSSVMVFRSRDMQVILNLLMGNDEEPTDDFVMDEMSISAACEVMNQMMGASATALSNFLGKTVDISPPEAVQMTDAKTFEDAMGLGSEDDIVCVSFRISINGLMNSDFINVISCKLAKELAGEMMTFPEEAMTPVQTQEMGPPPAAPAPQPAAAEPASAQHASEPARQQPVAQPAPPQTPPHGQYPQQPQQPAAGQYQQPGQPLSTPPGMGIPGQQAPGMPPQGYPPQQAPGMPPDWQMQYPQMPYGYYPYGYPPMMGPQGQFPQPPQAGRPQPLNVQTPKFPDFSGQQGVVGEGLTNSNMDLMMNVPLNVSVEIGKTKRKIREIMDFTQGTVIELEKQAGAPVDIVVNGQLIARGDVVVVDDNFGVRVTEIVGTKDLMDTLENT